MWFNSNLITGQSSIAPMGDTELLLSVKMMFWVTINSIFQGILISFNYKITISNHSSFLICDGKILVQLIFFIPLNDENQYTVLLTMLSLT